MTRRIRAAAAAAAVSTFALVGLSASTANAATVTPANAVTVTPTSGVCLLGGGICVGALYPG